MVRRSWTTDSSIEATLDLWASSLRDVKMRMRPLFRQDRVAASAGQFLDGLPGNELRKTGWMRAEAAGDRGPWRQQGILGRGHWDAMPFATSSAMTRWRRLPILMQCWLSMRPAS